ncbi:MAG: zinc-dependent metalloprotease [Pseudomonadales bacterium]|nr:zinc-dependent metalloprotease [Pseudomonadales bacterium]
MTRIDLWKLVLLILPLSLTLSVKTLAEDAPDSPESPTEEVAETASEGDEESAEGEGEEEEEEEEKPKTIAELTEEMDRIDGLFTIFRDSKTGATKMLLQGNQLGSEFIYFKHTMNGVTDAGAFTGSYGDQYIFTIERRFDKLQFVRQNTAYYFDRENAISRASEANISRAVLAVTAIAAEDEETGEVLIDSDALFLSEAFANVTYSRGDDDSDGRFRLGGLDAEKSQILELRNYPENTAVEVEYVFNNPKPKNGGSDAVTDARNVSINVRHTWIAVPENDYQPRFADARLGSFNVQVTDLTSTDSAPYRDLLERWHLVKKDPAAEISDPVEPITWWIENTTPVEWRDLIMGAALEWNKAFEHAGFSNAMVVKVQPDDADWDAGDIRYNVLRWTSSPRPPFGGYGPSFSNPRTGQLLGADIMLEYSFLNRSKLTRELIQGEALAPLMLGGHDARLCSVGHAIAEGGLMADIAIQMDGGDADIEEQLKRDRMYYLILHEIGHTLGMNHNMKATQLLSPEELEDPTVLESGIISGSVMDYPAVNYAPTREDQTLFYTIAPGPYDDWYIEYAYSPGLADPEAEAERLEAIAARSTEHALAFGNDADDMRSPGTGLDPRINIYDNSSDSIVYASNQMQILHDALNKTADWTPAEGDSYEDVVDGVALLVRLWGVNAGVISRWVGGVYVDRAVVGQAGATEPFTPVERDRQKQAMATLSEQFFGPGAFEVDGALWRQTAPERRGFEHGSTTEDPKVHRAVLSAQRRVLDHLLHPTVLRRITDTQLYGNAYPLDEVFEDLTDAMFEADARGSVNSFRRNLQTEYVDRLAMMASEAGASKFHSSAQALAVLTLSELRDELADKRRGDRASLAHAKFLALKIDRALAVD